VRQLACRWKDTPAGAAKSKAARLCAADFGWVSLKRLSVVTPSPPIHKSNRDQNQSPDDCLDFNGSNSPRQWHSSCLSEVREGSLPAKVQGFRVTRSITVAPSFAIVRCYWDNAGSRRICRILLREVNLMYTAELSSELHQSDEHSLFDDDQLVTAAQCGSESAFRELYHRNSRRVYWSISRVAEDRADAEDALQDSFMRAFIHIHQFDRRSSFSTWLTRIGINSALMTLRKNKRKAGETSIEFVDTTEDMRRELEFADLTANPEELCLINEMTSVINRAICQLPERLRIVTELKLNQNLSLQEISTTLHISILATKSRLHRGKQRILAFLHRNTAAMNDTKTGQFRTSSHHFWQQWAGDERAHARASRRNV